MPRPFDTLIKMLFEGYAGIQSEVRRKQAQQYMRPNEDILPRQPLRPTSLTKFTNQPFRSVAEYLPTGIILPPSVAGKHIADVSLPKKLDQTAANFRENPDVIKGLRLAPGSMGTIFGGLGSNLGLGQNTVSIGGDPQHPYVSIFDSWDDPSGIPEIDQKGTPFNVYDRIPFQLGPDNTIPEYIPSRGRLTDINLPIEGLKVALPTKKW